MEPLPQHPRFAAALRRLGREADVVEMAEGRAVVVRRRVPGLGRMGYLPRGPVWRTNDPGARASALGRLGVRLLDAEAPCPSLRAAGFRQVATAAHVAEWDLRPGAAARRAALHPKWRAGLRRAEAAGLDLREERWRGEPDHWLLRAEAAQRRARGYRAVPQALACTWGQEPEAAMLLSAWDRRGPVAGVLVLLHPPGASWLLGWNGEAGRAARAHHLLLMEAAERLEARGIRSLDLGLVDTEAGAGLARFKLGTGARPRALGGSWLRLPGLARPARTG